MIISKKLSGLLLYSCSIGSSRQSGARRNCRRKVVADSTVVSAASTELARKDAFFRGIDIHVDMVAFIVLSVLLLCILSKTISLVELVVPIVVGLSVAVVAAITTATPVHNKQSQRLQIFGRSLWLHNPLRLLSLGLATGQVRSSNWAQSSGWFAQDQVIPYYPSPNSPHWQARYGHVVVAVPNPSSTTTNGAVDLGSVFLMGGDTYDGDAHQTDIKPGMMDKVWYEGFKNDVWKMTGTQWNVRGDTKLSNGHKQRLAEVRSELKWTLVEKGMYPPRGTTYDEWISCEVFFQNRHSGGSGNDDCSVPRSVMWSPRRGHAAVFFQGYIYVMGGRAREFVDLPHLESVGGIVGPRVQDVQGIHMLYTTQREHIVVKNDVWKSADGVTWTLATPGCKRPQASLIAGGNQVEGKQGREQDACKTDSDCYGAETCGLNGQYPGTCVCPMWNAREQHAVATFDGFIYVMGGYASRLYSQLTDCGAYACGDMDASSYRAYMSDLWRSPDGATWTPVLKSIFPPSDAGLGRGGHQMLIFTDVNKNPYIWVMGGRNQDDKGLGITTYFNDIWNSPLDPLQGTTDTTFTQVTIPNQWSARASFTAVLEQGTASNGYVRTVYVIGGVNADTNDTSNFLDEVWGWRPDVPGDVWRQDFSPSALFGTGDGTQYRYVNNSPSVTYVSPNSPLALLQRYRLPTKVNSYPGSRLEMRPYLTQSKLNMLSAVGLNTISDLANADLYTILKLRGFDIPEVPLDQRMHFGDICDVRALATAVVSKCSVNLPNLYDGQRNMPWNVNPVFGGQPPVTPIIPWHGITVYSELQTSGDDVSVLTAAWDGCTWNGLIEGINGPNVNGLGIVSQVPKGGVQDPTPDLQNLFCKWTPGPRAFHAGLLFEERVYIFGGKQSERVFMGDTWYRDARLPTSRFSVTPPSYSSYPWFEFVGDKPGLTFEYRVWDPYDYKEIRPWTVVTKKTDIGWLSWRMKGPSDGLYTMYLRAVDPAGNRDERYALNRNVYTWYYVSPTPWDIILEVCGSFIGLCIIGYWEYRRRVKKAAMERYAMKRMRRKFKAMQRDIDGRALDWRTLYLESKEQDDIDARRKKGNKKMRDKKKEKREKEKKKREKEKERIKKKLKAGKDSKSKDKDKGGALEDDKGKSKKKKKKKGDDQLEAGDGGGEDGDFHSEMQGLLQGAGGLDAKAEKAKAKAKLKDDKKYKEYEEELAATQALEAETAASAAAGSAGAGAGAGGQQKRLKDYEKPAPQAPAGDVASMSAAPAPAAVGGAGELTKAPVAGADNNELEKEGAKQRRANKRYKDYEAQDESGNGNNKKDK